MQENWIFIACKMPKLGMRTKKRTKLYRRRSCHGNGDVLVSNRQKWTHNHKNSNLFATLDGIAWNGPTKCRYTLGFLSRIRNMCVCVWKFTIGFTTNHLNSNCVVAKWSKLLLHRKLIDLSHIFALDTNVVQLSIFGGRYGKCQYFRILCNMWIFLDPLEKIISIFCVMGEPTERKFIAPDINFSATIIWLS